jgi:type IV fimbrial biogenesis protein FimT
VLEAAQALPEGVAILSTAGRTRINYQPDGSSPGTNITLTVCDSRGADRATALIINNAGRVRSGTPTAAAAAACVNAIR